MGIKNRITCIVKLILEILKFIFLFAKKETNYYFILLCIVYGIYTVYYYITLQMNLINKTF